MGLGAATPSPRAFTAMAVIAVPIAIVLAGMLEFCILDGVSDFPLLALGLAPFEIGSALLITLPNPALSALGRINLIVIPVVFAPSNPQTYNPQVFLFTSLFACLATGLLLAAQFLIPPVSDDRRKRSLVASARRELHLALSRNDRRYAPEEAMFRDAVRVGQIAAAAGTGPQDRASIEEALSYFDQAAAIRFCGAKLTRLAHGPLASLAAQARTALLNRDAQRIRASAHSLRQAAGDDDSLATATSATLVLASAVIGAAPPQAANASRREGRDPYLS
jgi:Fusaric acid resistance protein family